MNQSFSASGGPQRASTSYSATPPDRSATPAPPVRQPVNRRRLLAIVGAGCVAAVGLLAGSALGYQAGKAGTQDYYQPQKAALVAQLNALQSGQAQQSAAAAAAPDLAAVAAEHPGLDPLNPTPTFLETSYKDTDPARKLAAIYAFMTELGFTGATLDQMSRTVAADGTRTARGHNCTASWIVRSGVGLQLVFEAKTA